MHESLLLIDQGNTRLKWMRAARGRLDPESFGNGSLEDLRQTVEGGGPAPTAVRVSSVAEPASARSVVDFCRQHWRLDARMLGTRAEQGGVRNAYPEPGRLGVDRWLAIVGAVDRYGAPVVIWDLGTASTIDAVDGKGQHLGGYIYPGPTTMLESLRGATQLPVPEGIDGDEEIPEGSGGTAAAPGHSTDACISHGVLAAQLGVLDHAMRYVETGEAGRARLVVTGGAAGSLLNRIGREHTHDPWLVFRGMLVD
jgi:type III pantothenate kinase